MTDSTPEQRAKEYLTELEGDTKSASSDPCVQLGLREYVKRGAQVCEDLNAEIDRLRAELETWNTEARRENSKVGLMQRLKKAERELDQVRADTLRELSTLYVVTFSPLGAEQGEFFREEAYVSEAEAMPSCIACMQQHGGRETFGEDYGLATTNEHVCRVWHGEHTSVWLEKLTLCQSSSTEKGQTDD